MIANVGSVLKVSIIFGNDPGTPPQVVRAQVISDGSEPASVWAVANDGGRNRYVLVKRVPKSEPAEWIDRWA